MMRRFKNLLFDFDGTIIDSSPGILGSLRMTFQELGEPVPEEKDLRWCIGPGIQMVAQKFFPDRDDLFRTELIRRFRAHYDGGGYLGSSLYPGIKQVLERLKADGYRLYLTTMKAKTGVTPLLEHLMLKELFLACFANDPYGPVRPKAEMISDFVRIEQVDPQLSAIIGDTYHDIHAGKENGLYSIGVTWGFGTERELCDAGADVIVREVAELSDFLIPFSAAST